MNELLSICIPTYNRAETLKGCLENLVPQVKKHDIPIYVLDNGSTDDTKEIVLKFKEKYGYIFYSLRKEGALPASNAEQVLKQASSEYRWLMGDRVRMIEGALDPILESLRTGDCKFIVVNALRRRGVTMVTDINNSAYYDDPDKLLMDLGWWMTFFGAVIWSRETVEAGDFTRYNRTEFPQVGVPFDYLSKNRSRVYWYAEPKTFSVGRSGWFKMIFDTNVTKWTDLIRSLPAVYTEDAKRKCIKDLGVKSHLFSIKGFIVLKSRGQYDLKKYNEFKPRFKDVTNVPSFILFLIAVMPPVPMFMIELIKRVRNLGLKL